MCPTRSAGFTLIELLIVVAIIAILAAIAVPNFLEAQVRAKYTRVVSDLRTVATALESYSVDNNAYPLNTVYNNYSVPNVVTTPIAYITRARLVDPFTRMRSLAPGTRTSAPTNVGDSAEDVQLYTYQSVMTLQKAQYFSTAKFAPNYPYEVPAEGIDAPGYNPGAIARYGPWKLVSFGPDGDYIDPRKSLIANLIQRTFDTPYDPTNGTTSFGNIYRTHKTPQGNGGMK